MMNVKILREFAMENNCNNFIGNNKTFKNALFRLRNI